MNSLEVAANRYFLYKHGYDAMYLTSPLYLLKIIKLSHNCQNLIHTDITSRAKNDKTNINKLGLYWAKLSSSWYWTLLQFNTLCRPTLPFTPI